MKEVLMLVGVFGVGYLLTMGFLYAAFKFFFPFMPSEKETTNNSIAVMKVSRNAPHRSAGRLRKVRLANG